MAKNTPASQEFEVDETVSETASTGDAQERVQVAKKPRLQPFPAGMYRLAIAGVLALAGQCARETYLDHRDPDGRSFEETAKGYIMNRRAVAGNKSDTPPSDALIKGLGNNAECILNQQGNPLGDGYEGKKKVTHKRETTDFFVDNRDPKKPKKYEYWSNLNNYVYEMRPQYNIASVWNTYQDKDTRDSISWFTEHLADYQKGSDQASVQAALKEMTEALMHQRLKCVQAFDGSCIKLPDGTDCLLVADLADAVSRANYAMHEDGKGQIMPSVCFRSNEMQATYYGDIGQVQCEAVGSHPNGKMVNVPGESNHEEGMAMDLRNPGQAEEYLAGIGMGCDKVEGDPGHCSFGEDATRGKLKSVRIKLKQVGTAIKKGWKIGVEIWRNRKK